MKLRVIQQRLEAAGVISVVLEDDAGRRLPAWAPGAHVPVTLSSGVVRQYSLCGPRDDPHRYTIAVLLVVDGRGGSREVHQSLRVGDVIEVGPPRNDFELLPAPSYLFIAGGIGVTPILAMVEALRAQTDPPPMRVVYGGRNRSAMAFLDRLATLGGVEVICEAEAGRPDLAALFADAAAGTRVYCCGPPAMLTAVQEVGDAYPDLSVHIERFTAVVRDPAPVADGAFDVELARTGVTVTVGRSTSVLDAVLEVAPDTAFSCTDGFCGTCETKVLAGEIDHRVSLLTDDERQSNSTMMICVSRSSCGGKLILDL
ncbi:PDR/VanB family oxidoreductase [Mycolicibacterium lacusdiani]|uniref:PDR/VanB family oxidoreductase n=1 Tax=Mycolicibacterium lacusdiani TaxID=2895283 RepID=UPI001F46472D|nr:PDR/VanB family oxidoreductase [Mycolicibacterium lacusdiani]